MKKTYWVVIILLLIFVAGVVWYNRESNFCRKTVDDFWRELGKSTDAKLMACSDKATSEGAKEECKFAYFRMKAVQVETYKDATKTCKGPFPFLLMR